MSIFLDKLPDCIEVDGEFFSLKTDFRTWLAFSSVVNTKKATVNDVDFVYADEVPPAEKKKACFEKLLDFFHPEQKLPKSDGSGDKVLDYEIDAQLIYSAFLEQYQIDLLATDESGHFIPMHWHRFLALLSGLHNTKLNDVMGWRCWNGDVKTEYGKSMAKLRDAWALPAENEEEIQKDLDSFNALFNK